MSKKKQLILVVQSKKTDYDAKISKIKNKYITTDDYNKFTKDIAANKIKSKILVDKSAVVGFMNNDDLYKKQQHQQQKIN